MKTALRQELALSDLPDNWLAGVCGACREEEEKHIASEIARCDGRLEEIGREISEKEDFLKALTEGGENASLTTLAIQTLIDRIEVYGGRRVKIIWRGRRAIE